MSASNDLLKVSGQEPGVQCVMKTLQKDQSAASHHLPKKSKALESVKSFLPQLAAANEVLQQQMVGKPAEEFDIEHVTEEEGPVVEMDLALVELDESSDSDNDDSSESDSSNDEGEEVKQAQLITILDGKASSANSESQE